MTPLAVLPLQTYDVTDIETGAAILLVGVLALLAIVAIQLRNPLAIAAWGFSILMLVFSGLFQIGFEYVWLSILATGVLVILGAAVRGRTA